MKLAGSIALGASGLLSLGLVIVPLVTAQNPRLEAQAFVDVNSTLSGTWTLKQRTNPDGTPYRSRLQGITYVTVGSRTGDLLGPHAVATLYSKESGVADTHFFNYPADVAGKPFEMEASSTWMLRNLNTTAQASQISVQTFTMVKGSMPGYTNGLMYNADVRYNLTRPATAGAAVVPRMDLASLAPSEMLDFTGKRVQSASMVSQCCGMTALSVSRDAMEISWNNKGKDTWVRSAKTVPDAFR